MISNYSYKKKAVKKKSAVELIKYVSIETYNRIGFVHRYSVNPIFLLRTGEVTLTENLLYELHKFSIEKKLTLVRMFEAKNEGKNGADMLLDLPVAGGYIRVPVQAKRLYLGASAQDGSYPMMRHRSGVQTKLLKAYAARLGSFLPLYLLYNYTHGNAMIPASEKEYYYGCSYLNANHLPVVQPNDDFMFSDLHPSPGKPFYRLFEYFGRNGGGGGKPAPSDDPKKELIEFYAHFGVEADDAFLKNVRIYTREEIFADNENWKDVFSKDLPRDNEEWLYGEGFDPRYRIVLLSGPEVSGEADGNRVSDGGNANTDTEADPPQI